MYNVTETFHTEAFSASREITVRATFNDTVEIDGNHLKDMTIEEIVSADNLSIGSTCSSKATINMFMPEEAIPLSNGWMNLYVGIPTECPLGKYYIADVVTKDKYKTVTITAYDKMWHLNKSYVPGANMTFPATVSAVVMDIAEQNDFEVDFDSFPDYEIPLVEATEREMIGYCAGLMGKNAKFNRDGKLTFVWFADTDRDIPLEAQYQGGFSETTADSFVLGGLVSGTEENPLTAGSGRTITFSNPFMTQEILDGILNEVAGFTYTPCEVKYRCDPSFETGDIVDVVDDDSDITAVYPVPIMAQKIKVGGGLNATIYAYGKSEESEILIKAPSDGKIERAKGELEKYLEGITGNIVGKNGGYYHITYDDLGFPNGWEIMNTPTLTPETKLWKMSAGGFGFSNDGGGSFSKLAFDMEGNFYADCIRGGSISTAGALGRNILIDEDSIEIRNGETTLASFEDDTINLGPNKHASINLCGNAARMYVENLGEEFDLFVINSEYMLDLTAEKIVNVSTEPGDGMPRASVRLSSSYGEGAMTNSSIAQLSASDLPITGQGCATGVVCVATGDSPYINIGMDRTNSPSEYDIEIIDSTNFRIKPRRFEFSSGDLYMDNGMYIYNKFADGSDAIMVAMNGSNQQLFGYSGYQSGIGETYFDGNKVYIRSNSTILLNGYDVPTAIADTNGYYQLGEPVGRTSHGWIRTPLNGILPNKTGGSSYIGATTWPFTAGYFNNVYVGGTAVSVNGHTHYSLYNATQASDVIMTYCYSKNATLCVEPASTAFEVTLGRNTTGKRYKAIYLLSSPSVSSDMRLKEELNTDMTKYVEMMDLIEPTSYLRKDDSDTERKRNVGYIAQKVWKALKTVGLEEKDFAGFIKDIQDEGSVYSYALAYEQFIPILHARQDRDKAELLARIERIEKALGISDVS